MDGWVEFVCGQSGSDMGVGWKDETVVDRIATYTHEKRNDQRAKFESESSQVTYNTLEQAKKDRAW